ncbi:EAL domain-containing protein [Halomonas sp. GFAJ-1]|uniref:EAL domain-containing protein n=1 Tax=Halomonas sp. GFAJ-1 TaxID=1118153 RepID=UPI00023A33E3|nr:EAL domain-containing protein [Halomonas sp. GFAJ-1]AVI61589.1 PAS domain S-box protein [Halomonas sp. GFAJ-1]EHK59902.1 signal protein [Halomonas sp. GFAJ-1]
MPIVSNLLVDPSALNAVQGHYIPHLVLLSWVIALAACYAGLDIIKLVGKAQRASWRRIWLLAGASVMGLGVWSMHFIGMHAYRLDFPVSHAPLLTALSIFPAILGSLGAMAVLSREALPHRAVVWAGAGLGLGIGIMHYTGMAAMQLPATLYYAVDLFLLSLAVAVGLGVLTVYAYRLCRQEWGMQRSRRCAFIAALCASVAICGMHYVAMGAAWFVPQVGAHTEEAVEHAGLIYLIGGMALFIALLTLTASWVRRRLDASERHEHMTRTRLLEVLSALQDGVVLFDHSARIRLCNAAFERLLGLDAEHSLGFSLRQLAYSDDSHSLNTQIQHSLASQGEWRGLIQARHRDGRRFPAWLSVSRVTYANSDEWDYVALLSDRTEEQQAAQRIRYLAYHDSLTELPNRRALQERLAECGHSNAAPHRLALLVLFDIDRFKVLNDSLGQDVGDELLRQLSQRLQHGACPGQFVARLDGNEFALLTSLPLTSMEIAEQAARRLTDERLATLTADYQLHGHTYPCRFNVGMLIFSPKQQEGAALLFKRAGLALVEAKRQRDGKPSLFCTAFERELEERHTLERELRYAIGHGELLLHLQPQVDASGRSQGAEALVRWQHPARGQISPGSFIPIAEETGLILPLGHWVLREGCRILGEWQHDPRYRDIKLSINVSVRQFQQPDFVDQVIAAMNQFTAPAKLLTLELTESLLLSDPAGTIAKMSQLRKLGVRFALDDFGTGYSSLAYLQSLPLDTLKIDIAFVRDLTRDMQATPIAATIIALAKSLNLSVIAEGVETEEQREVLAGLGCSAYQGYLFGRPVPIEHFNPALFSANYADSSIR